MVMREGHWYWIHWADIQTDSVGDARKAELATCRQAVIFHSRKRCKIRNKVIPCLVFKLAEYESTPEQDGWQIIPEALVLSASEIKE